MLSKLTSMRNIMCQYTYLNLTYILLKFSENCQQFFALKLFWNYNFIVWMWDGLLLPSCPAVSPWYAFSFPSFEHNMDMLSPKLSPCSCLFTFSSYNLCLIPTSLSCFCYSVTSSEKCSWSPSPLSQISLGPCALIASIKYTPVF